MTPFPYITLHQEKGEQLTTVDLDQIRAVVSDGSGCLIYTGSDDYFPVKESHDLVVAKMQELWEAKQAAKQDKG